MDLPHATIGIWQPVKGDGSFYLTCFRTDTKMSHNSLYLIHELNLTESMRAHLIAKSPLILFGYEMFGGHNYLFLNIVDKVLPLQIYFHSAI